MKRVFYFLGFILIIVLLSCNRNVKEESAGKNKIFNTWLSLNQMKYEEPVVPLSLIAEISKQDFLPWAGIVSHHILAHDYIDAWFYQLSKMRNPKRFFIINPDHFSLSLEHYSLTTGAWDSGFGLVETDKKKVKELTELLQVDLDERVFEMDHGVSALMPYIKKHFPDTKVVPIIVNGDPIVNTYIIGRLADLLEKEFTKEGKTDNFLIISSDFSHRGDIEETKINDFYSQQYLIDTANVPWNIVWCDNKSGICILDRLGKKNMASRILSYTNSFEISGVDEDITSYFFVYFGDAE